MHHRSTRMHAEVLSLLLLAGSACAHMSLWYPGPLGGTTAANRFSTKKDINPELNWPLGCCDSQGRPTTPSPGVCRGHLDLFDSEDAQVTWQPGQAAYFQLSDYAYTADAPGGTHDGGSCQVGFSIDRGETWKVAASYNGNCPLRGKPGSPEVQTFDFKVPTGMPTGKALFGWIWLNREHESYMNCAVVYISDVPANDAVFMNPTTPASATKEVATPPNSASSVTRAANPSRLSASASSAHGGRGGDAEQSLAIAPHDREAVETQHPAKTSDPMSESSLRNKEQGFRKRWESNKHKATKRHGHRWEEEYSSERSSGDHSSQKRSLAGYGILQAVRRGARTERIDACAWDTAPSMMVSYFTVDAACAPNAKMTSRASDAFEIGWNEPCGVVEGDGEYPIKFIDCDMFS